MHSQCNSTKFTSKQSLDASLNEFDRQVDRLVQDLDITSELDFDCSMNHSLHGSTSDDIALTPMKFGVDELCQDLDLTLLMVSLGTINTN